MINEANGAACLLLLCAQALFRPMAMMIPD
jgi:hypothetical protein